MLSSAVQRHLPILFALLAAAPSVQAQTPQQVDVPTIPAKPEDVGSLDGIMKAFYDVISGPAGQPRQWSRDRTLYIPEIRFVSVSVDKNGKVQASTMTHQQFVDGANGGMVKQGFFETELHRVTRSFGKVTHIFSSYEMRSKPDGPVFGRGVNSIQLYNDGTRWWIASVEWDDERDGNPIPKELLP
jgi:hypothetical protein